MDSTPQENSDGKNSILPQGNGCTAHLYFVFMIAFDVWGTLPPSGKQRQKCASWAHVQG